MSIDLTTSKILLVDDEPDNLLLLQTIFNFHDIEPVCVGSGHDAMMLLTSRTFDLALVDIQMPKITGWDILKSVRDSVTPAQRNMIVIAVTALAMDGDRERVIRAGFDGYISKPVETVQFLPTVQNIVDLVMKRREDHQTTSVSSIEPNAPSPEELNIVPMPLRAEMDHITENATTDSVDLGTKHTGFSTQGGLQWKNS